MIKGDFCSLFPILVGIKYEEFFLSNLTSVGMFEL